MSRHVHADLIIAWAEGKQIQYYSNTSGKWIDPVQPCWDSTTRYRIKPEKKTPYQVYCEANVLANHLIGDERLNYSFNAVVKAAKEGLFD